jgi:hypothetical protein
MPREWCNIIFQRAYGWQMNIDACSSQGKKRSACLNTRLNFELHYCSELKLKKMHIPCGTSKERTKTYANGIQIFSKFCLLNLQLVTVDINLLLLLLM